jgi:hypothetical protein
MLSFKLFDEVTWFTCAVKARVAGAESGAGESENGGAKSIPKKGSTWNSEGCGKLWPCREVD